VATPERDILYVEEFMEPCNVGLSIDWLRSKESE
jgi:hypothetical protein